MDTAQKLWEEWRNHIAGGTLIISRKLKFYRDVERKVEDEYFEAMTKAHRQLELNK